MVFANDCTMSDNHDSCYLNPVSSYYVLRTTHCFPITEPTQIDRANSENDNHGPTRKSCGSAERRCDLAERLIVFNYLNKTDRGSHPTRTYSMRHDVAACCSTKAPRLRKTTL